MEKITVVGVGRMGLCFALALENAGFDVLGLDIVEDYVERLNSKKLNSSEPNVSEYLSKSNNFKATTDLEEALDFSNTIFVMLRTGNVESGKYDHRYIEVLLKDMQKLGRRETFKDIIICSNVSPGYSNEIQERLRGMNYVVSFNPEWIAQGRIIHDFENPDMVIIGTSSVASGDKIERIHKTMCNNDPKICRMDRKSAEIVKIGLNSFLTVKIAYANLLGEIAINSGVAPAPILEALGSDSRICDKYFKYGFGYGGPCFPRDVRSFIYYGKEVGVEPNIVEAVIEANKNHTDFQVEHFIKTHSKSNPVTVDHVAYKQGTVIIDESQQLLFAVKIAKAGYAVIIKECKEIIDQIEDIYGGLFKYEEK